MPPKIKITKEEIVQAGLELVRRGGESSLNARNIAATLGCSTQPIFSNYASMEELRSAVIVAAVGVYDHFVADMTVSSPYPAYKASGMAYIQFAKEERNLFCLLFMRDRENREEPYEIRMFDKMGEMVSNYIGLENDRARLFHLEMWAFVHGIATMMATGYLELNMELVSVMMTDAYQGIKQRFDKE